MKPRILALSAIGTTFALGILRQAAIWATVILAVLLAIIWMLTYFFSDWWWLLAIPVAGLALIALTAWVVVRFIVKRLQPVLTKKQRLATEQFVEKAQRLFENATTPYPLLAIRLVLDVLFQRRPGLLSEVLSDSKGLQPEMDKVIDQFKR